jgi:hypothetical protein
MLGLPAFGLLTVLVAPAPPAPAAGPAPSLIKLAPQAERPNRPLRYPLLPDPLDMTPGNAATLWVRAGLAQQEVRRALKPTEYAWFFMGGAGDAPPPAEEVTALLHRFAPALRQGAANDATFGPMLSEVQINRETANLLRLRFRSELQAGRFDKAAYTLQTAFTLARHVGNSNSLIENLVGAAIASITFTMVEEWQQTPGSPNLYWSLTALPSPLVDVRAGVECDLNNIHHSFPALRKITQAADAPGLTKAQAERLVDEVFAETAKVGSPLPPPLPPVTGGFLLSGKAALALEVFRAYPEVKKRLVARGRPAKEVDALPSNFGVLLDYVETLDETRDKTVKLFSLPPWQSRPAREQLEKEAKEQAGAGGVNLLAKLTVPACLKVYEAQVRLQRFAAGLRVAEALRAQLAATGKVPARLADVTVVPLPIDPATGEGFDAFYKVEDGVGILSVPPPPGPGAAPSLLRRYELGRPR